MPNCDFYAVDRHFAPILDFLFAQPGWVLIESSSRHDERLRRFRTRGGRGCDARAVLAAVDWLTT